MLPGDTISMNIAINSTASATQTIDVASGTTLIFSGGNLERHLAADRDRPGILTLNQPNTFGAGESPHVSEFQITDNTLVQVENSKHFGNNANPVTVADGSEVTLSGGISPDYNISLTGYGLGSSDGNTSPLISVSGTNTWLGNINFNASNSGGNMYFVVGPDDSPRAEPRLESMASSMTAAATPISSSGPGHPHAQQCEPLRRHHHD